MFDFLPLALSRDESFKIPDTRYTSYSARSYSSFIGFRKIDVRRNFAEFESAKICNNKAIKLKELEI